MFDSTRSDLLLHECELMELLRHVHELRQDVQLVAGQDAEGGHRASSGHVAEEVRVLEIANADQVGPVDALNLPGQVRVPVFDGCQWWRGRRRWLVDDARFPVGGVFL